MAYCRENSSSNEITDIFMSRGSYLEMDNTELVAISGKTARVQLYDEKINVYKVLPATGRYSYKVYGQNVSEFNIDDVSQTFQAYRDYNYLKSTNLIADFSAQIASTNEINIHWNCAEQHDIIIHYWQTSDPSGTYASQTISDVSSGTHCTTLNLNTGLQWGFRIEGKMDSDTFIDLTSEFLSTNIPVYYLVILLAILLSVIIVE
jgi:hypothetical protein